MKKNRPEERNMRIVKVNKDSIANILSDLLKRSPTNYGDFQDKVDAIIKNVRDNGDKAVFDYTAQFDKAEINAENILVTEEEIKEAYEEVDDELIKVIRKARHCCSRARCSRARRCPLSWSCPTTACPA